MGWLALIFAVYVICIIVWALKDDKPCERVEMGYNCRGDKCECRKVQYED